MAVEHIARPEAPELAEPYFLWRQQQFQNGQPPSLWDAFLAGSAVRDRMVRHDREPIHTALERFGLSGLHLTGREARVVAALARSETGCRTREEIIREVWGLTVDVDDLDSRRHLVRVIVARARPKLDTRGVCLGTLPSLGYRLHHLADAPCALDRSARTHGFIPLCRRVVP